MRDSESLSRRERQIMEIVHQRGLASVREITDALPDPPTEDSIRAILRILERKGLLLRRDLDGKLAYAPAETPDSARRTALKRVLETFFGGSLEAAVATFLTDEEASVSPDELERLAARVAEAREKENEK
ncbi:MAG: BlaI/MecI/CopY family transcriptional regulator [Armatimonas sp.]